MPVTRRQAEKMKTKEEPYPTRTTRASASKAEQKHDLVGRTQIPPEKDLRGLKRADIQKLAKRHKIPANSKSEHIIKALIRVRAAGQVTDLESAAKGRLSRHGNQQGPASAEAPPIASSSRLPVPEQPARRTASRDVEECLVSLNIQYGVAGPQPARHPTPVAAAAAYPTSPAERQRATTVHRQATARLSPPLPTPIPPAVRATQPTNRDLLAILSRLRRITHQHTPRPEPDPRNMLSSRHGYPTNRDLLEIKRQILQPLLMQKEELISKNERAERALQEGMRQLEEFRRRSQDLEGRQQIFQEVLHLKWKTSEEEQERI